VLSLQVRSEGSSSQCAPDGPSGAWWNDKRNDIRMPLASRDQPARAPSGQDSRQPWPASCLVSSWQFRRIRSSSWCVPVGSNDGPWDDERNEGRHSNLLLADGPLSHKGCWPAEAWETEPHTKRVMAATRPGGRIPSTSISVYRRGRPEEDRRASARPGSSRSRITVRLKSSVPTR